MLDIGQDLRQARELRGLSIEDMMARTMIPKKYLLALEEEQFPLFPGEVYLKGALRKYAIELGLDAQELLGRLADSGGKETSATENAPVAAPTKKYNSAHRDIRVHGTGKNYNFFKLLQILFIIFILAGGAYIVIRELYQKEQPLTNPPVTDVQPDDKNSSSEPDDITPDPEQNEQPQVPAVSVERDTTTGEVRFIVRNAETIQASMSVTAACWVSVSTDGTESFTGTIAAGQTRDASAGQSLTIRIGNPLAFALKINGQLLALPNERTAYTLTVLKQ